MYSGTGPLYQCRAVVPGCKGPMVLNKHFILLNLASIQHGCSYPLAQVPYIKIGLWSQRVVAGIALWHRFPI